MELKTEIKEVIEQAIKGGYTLNEATDQISSLFDVSQQSELLVDFAESWNKNHADFKEIDTGEIKDFLSTYNG